MTQGAPRVRIADSDLEVFPLAFGGNVFGWTADRDTSFALLDAFVEGGGDFIDTADMYSLWAPGNSGGESETIIGEWLAARKPRDVVIATKGDSLPPNLGLGAASIRRAVEASLQRLGVDTIDLYYAHHEDPNTPIEETVAAFGQMVADGLVRHIAVSNHSAERTRAWIAAADELGVPRPVATQQHYNLVHRNDVEAHIMPLAEEYDLGIMPYYALASGFLTGKYRQRIDAGDSPRAGEASKYATSQGLAILDELERVGANHGASITATALAWLRAQPQIVAPVASASKLEQLPDLLAGATLELSPEELESITAVSTWTPPAR